MPFELNQVVPWGRSYDEYVRMFDLRDEQLGQRILGCADGPAAFNAELTHRGGQIMSCDPLYGYSSAEIKARINECFELVLRQTRNNADGFVWSETIPSVEALGDIRRQAMDAFLRDLPIGRSAGRYVAAELPDLPFRDGAFDLALCSHFLFLYDTLGLDFHRQSVASLLRVAQEVRIFPLLTLDRRLSPYLNQVVQMAESIGCTADVVPTNYEFQRGANRMLVLRNEVAR